MIYRKPPSKELYELMKPAKKAWLESIKINEEKIKELQMQIADAYSRIAWLESSDD